jgi:excisionase family DNA binding protein
VKVIDAAGAQRLGAWILTGPVAGLTRLPTCPACSGLVVAFVSPISYVAFVARRHAVTPLVDIARPSPDIAAEAGEAARSLAPLLRKRKGGQHITLVAEGDLPARVVVPRAALELFVRILGEMASGNAVTIVPVHAELTTQQAAELLNVSRPFMVKLLEEGRLPFRLVGTRRRVRFEDLARFRQRDDEERSKVMDELTAEAQRLGLEY